MGKHEAPSSAKKKSQKHVSEAGASFLDKLSIPKVKLPDFSKIKDLPARFHKNDVEESEEWDDDEFDDEDDADKRANSADASETEEVKIYAPKKSREEASLPENKEAIKLPKEELDEEDELDDEEDDETEAPDKLNVRKITLPKPDLSAARAFLEKLICVGTKEGEGSQAHRRSIAFDRNHVLLAAGGALLFFLLWLLPTKGWVRFVLYLIPFCLLGVYTFLDAAGEILDRQIPGRNLLISIASLGLLCLGQPRAAVFVMLMHRVFLLLEAYIFEKKASSLEQLEALAPDSAVADTEEGLVRRSPDSFSVGDTLFVPAGELVALDGVVIEGISSLDASPLCGSGSTKDVGVNSRVFAGCRNLTNPLRVRVTNTEADSTVKRYIARARHAMESTPSRASLPDKILSYLPMALSVAGVVAALLVSILTGSWRVWIYRGLLLIALGGCGDTLLSARMAYFSGIFDAAKDGISYLDADVIDAYAKSDMMIFSKTGSVTEGKYTVAAVYPVEYEEKDLLTIAALAECQSTHPIAVALREACGIEMHHRSDITLLEETPGRGIHTLFGGRNVYVGNSTLLLDHNIVFDVPSHKGTIIHVAVDNKYAGCIVLNDRIRDGAFDAIEELRLRGIRATVMLTGDVRSMARPIASSLNFDMVKCELSNESKSEALRYLRESKGNSAAIDYVSSKDEDLELLQQAEVGVGFAALTEYKLMESASVLIPGSKIFLIPQSLYLAKRISFAALLCAAIMLGMELLMLVLGLTGLISIWAAMLLLLIARIATLVYSVFFR